MKGRHEVVRGSVGQVDFDAQFPFCRRGGFFLPWQKKDGVVLGADRRYFFEGILPCFTTLPRHFVPPLLQKGEFRSNTAINTTPFTKRGI